MSTTNSTTNSTTGSPPFFEITDIDHGPWAVVVAFCTISLITFIAAIRFLLASRLKVKFQLDDLTFAVATVSSMRKTPVRRLLLRRTQVFGIVNGLCFYRAVVAGLGQHITDVDPDSLITYYKVSSKLHSYCNNRQLKYKSKLMYAAQLLGILSQTAAKVSVVMLFKRIVPANVHHHIFLACVGVWSIASIFMIAFQCQLPSPWVFVPSQCTTHGNVQYPYIIVNMVTDIMLATGILPTVWNLNTRRETRIAVIMLFASRFV
jgi:hypothetical protein